MRIITVSSIDVQIEELYCSILSDCSSPGPYRQYAEYSLYWLVSNFGGYEQYLVKQFLDLRNDIREWIWCEWGAYFCKLSVYCETFIWQIKTDEQYTITTIYTLWPRPQDRKGKENESEK